MVLDLGDEASDGHTIEALFGVVYFGVVDFINGLCKEVNKFATHKGVYLSRDICTPVVCFFNITFGDSLSRNNG